MCRSFHESDEVSTFLQKVCNSEPAAADVQEMNTLVFLLLLTYLATGSI